MESRHIVSELSSIHQEDYKKSKIILSFEQYLDLVKANPVRYTRNAAQYLLDVFDFYGTQKATNPFNTDLPRFTLFDLGTTRGVKIVAGERSQSEIYNILQQAVKHGFMTKLVLLYGPNGSSKSSTVETITHAMQQYSKEDQGAVYRFNWIFPADKNALPLAAGDSHPIGFTKDYGEEDYPKSYAFLDESRISAKIVSDFKENPLFLIPTKHRKQLLSTWISETSNIPIDEVAIPAHMLEAGLSTRNQQIFNNLLNSYHGNLGKVFRHIQIERFFYSRQYRVGLSTVEPQMALDAREKQITLDKNYSNLPAVLHTINFYQSEGELVEANRGVLELSDLLKRPVEAFKYLLNTLEKQSINLTSGTAKLDIVFFATTNDKHLDAFKTIPDFSSFKGRFDLVNVPYLLIPSLEEEIYHPDIDILKKTKKISPHSLELLCNWAVLTRLKQPDPDNFPKEYRQLIAKLDPYSKLRLYSGAKMQPEFSIEEQNTLKEIRHKVYAESEGMIVYEGRFGASPRELRSILYRSAQNNAHPTLTPLAIIEELENLKKDRTVYEFLQFEPRGQYHDIGLFITIAKKQFLQVFEQEVAQSMSMTNEEEYHVLLKRYIDHVVSQIKKEKIFDEATGSYVLPSEKIMEDIEKIIGIKKQKADHRTDLLSRIASYKLENPNQSISIPLIFEEYLNKIKAHYYHEKEKVIQNQIKVMISYSQNETDIYSEADIRKAKETYKNLADQFGYDEVSAFRCLQFLMKEKIPAKDY